MILIGALKEELQKQLNGILKIYEVFGLCVG